MCITSTTSCVHINGTTNSLYLQLQVVTNQALHLVLQPLFLHLLSLHVHKLLLLLHCYLSVL